MLNIQISSFQHLGIRQLTNTSLHFVAIVLHVCTGLGRSDWFRFVFEMMLDKHLVLDTTGVINFDKCICWLTPRTPRRTNDWR